MLGVTFGLPGVHTVFTISRPVTENQLGASPFCPRLGCPGRLAQNRRTSPH